MNNPDNMPIDIPEQRDWINSYKAEKELSWTQLASLCDIASGTLSTFGGGTYAGRNDKIAREVFKFRQTLYAKAERSEGLAVAPGYFETQTSKRLIGLLTIAHLGRITIGAMGPGTGKTITAREYQASNSSCWMATMKESTRSPNAMISRVLRAVGAPKTTGWGAQLSDYVAEQVRGKNGLLIIDEANHLTLQSLEEIRAWHDETGVGICLLGNEELLLRIRGGARRDAFGRLNSRIAESHIQNVSVPDDVDAFCDAWGLTAPAMRNMLMKIAQSPGSGGLRECRQIVERASMLAADDDRALTFADLRDAQSTRASNWVKTEEAR
ncbi:MAG: AAA family ATPase [Pseudomonadota bacterium]